MSADMACPVCDFVYDPVAGLPREGYPAGTAWEDLPEEFTCPDCGVRDKVDFTPVGASA